MADVQYVEEYDNCYSVTCVWALHYLECPPLPSPTKKSCSDDCESGPDNNPKLLRCAPRAPAATSSSSSWWKWSSPEATTTTAAAAATAASGTARTAPAACTTGTAASRSPDGRPHPFWTSRPSLWRAPCRFSALRSGFRASRNRSRSGSSSGPFPGAESGQLGRISQIFLWDIIVKFLVIVAKTRETAVVLFFGALKALKASRIKISLKLYSKNVKHWSESIRIANHHRKDFCHPRILRFGVQIQIRRGYILNLYVKNLSEIGDFRTKI